MPRFLRQMGARNARAQRDRGRSAPMARTVGAGTRLPRRERARAADRPAAVAGAWPGGDSRRVPRAAFLAPCGRSQRSRRLRSPQRRPMPQRAKGGDGTHPRASGDQENIAHSAGGRPYGGRPCAATASERRPREYRAQRGRPPLRRPHVRSNSERAAIKHIMRTARAAAHGGRTCEPTFFWKTVDKAKRWCYHSSHQRRGRQSRYESSTHGPQLRLFLYLWLYVYA